MQQDNNITTKQFIWLLYILFASFAVFQAPGLLINVVGRDAWITVIIAWILDVVLGLIYSWMGQRFYRKNFVEHNIILLGKYVGGIIGFILPFFFILSAMSAQYNLNTVMEKSFFPETPFVFLVLTSHLLTAYALKKGIGVIGRVCEMIGPIFLISIVFVFVLIMSSLDIKRVEPIFANGFLPILSGSYFILTFLGICIMMTMFTPIAINPKKTAMAKFIASSMGAFVIFMVVLCSIGEFDVRLSKNLYYTSLELAKSIYLAGDIERIEIIWVVIVIGAEIISSTIMTWAFALGISQIFGLKDYKRFIYPSTLLSIALCITSFNNDIEYNNFFLYVYPFFPTIITFIEAVLLIIALIFKKSLKNN